MAYELVWFTGGLERVLEVLELDLGRHFLELDGLKLNALLDGAVLSHILFQLLGILSIVECQDVMYVICILFFMK